MASPIKAILLSRDAQALSTIDQTLELFSIEADLCFTAGNAQTLIHEHKFDLLVLDLDLPGALELMEFDGAEAWKHPTATIAVAEASVLKRALSKHVNFVLQKPFTEALMTRTLKAAYSIIAKEKRAKFREAVEVPASASFLDNGEKRPLSSACLRDLSETGLCLSAKGMVSKGATIFVAFELPESGGRVHATGKVIWRDAGGEMGVQFISIPEQEGQELQRWVRARCPWDVELQPRAAELSTAKPVKENATAPLGL